MKTTRIVSFLMVLSILWCADAFAHSFGDNKPVAHFCPGTSGDPCKGTSCDVGSHYDGGHGHINSYDDDIVANDSWDLGEENNWGYWNAGGYAVVRGDAPDTGCGEGNIGNNGGGNNGGLFPPPLFPPPLFPPPLFPPPLFPPPLFPPPLFPPPLFPPPLFPPPLFPPPGNNGGGNNGGGNNGGGNNGGGNPDRNPNPNPPPPAVATKLVKISGDGQEGLINTELANPFIVEVHDQNNAAFDGATVTFDIIAGGGRLSTTITTTNANGRAEGRLTLGPNLGTNTVSVSVEGIQGTETFSAEAVETLTSPTDGNNNGNGNNDGGNNQEPDIPQRTDPESEMDRRFAFQLDLYAGWNFVHIPLEVTQVEGESMSIETLGNLFQVLMPTNMYVYDGTCWMEVFGDSTQGLGTTQGVAVYMDAPKTVNLVGTPLPTTFTLERGMNFVGLPRQSANLRKVSDFLAFYPKVCAVLVAVDGELYLVGRAGDSGDVEITGGQAFGIISVEQYMTSFGGAAWGKVFVE